MSVLAVVLASVFWFAVRSLPFFVGVPSQPFSFGLDLVRALSRVGSPLTSSPPRPIASFAAAAREATAEIRELLRSTLVQYLLPPSLFLPTFLLVV